MNLPAQGAYFNSGRHANGSWTNSGNRTSRSAPSNFWKTGADTIGFGTSRPSTFFFTAGLTSCPSIGIERPGSLTSRRRTIWAVCFIIRVRRHGCAKNLALPRRCSSDSQSMQVWLSIGGRPSIGAPNTSGFGEARWRRYVRRRSLWNPFFTRFPDAGRRQRITKGRHGIGLIIYVTPQADGVFIAGASPKFRI